MMRTLFLAVAGLAFGFTACSSYGTSAVEVTRPAVASVSVAVPATSIVAGQSERASAVVRDANGVSLPDRAVTWHSSTSTVASVDDAGMITALAVGSSVITASAEGVSGQASIDIVAQPPIPVASVSVSLAASSLNPTQTTQASAQTLDANGNALSGRAISWSSSNTGVATVSGAGLVTAVATGTAQIIASSEGKSGNALLTVAAPPAVPVASVTVSLASSALNPGQTTQATAATMDANNNVLTGRAVTWSSSNTAIATVSSTGLVTAIAVGTVQILASCEGKSGNSTLTVAALPPAPVATVTVALAPGTINVGATSQASATTRDANNNVLTGRTIVWSSSNQGVASVSASGLVTGIAAGTAQITATSENKTGNATITVQTPPPPPPPGSTNEPSGMTLITERPFNALNELGWADVSGAGTSPKGSITIVQDPTAPMSPSNILRATYPQGFSSIGDGPGSSDYNLPQPRTVYVSWWIRLSSNFYGHEAAVNKEWYLWSGNTPLLYFDASCQGTGPITPRIALQDTKSNGTADLAPNLVPSARMPRGQWVHFEAVVVGNTAGTKDGSVDWWMDGVHIGSYTIQWTTGATTWNLYHLSTIWGGSGGPNLPVTMTVDWDHVYISGKN